MRFIIKFFLLSLFFLTSSPVFAIDYFSEDFSTKNDSNWTFYNEAVSNIDIDDGVINLSTDTDHFPVVVSKNIVLPIENDFTVEVKFRYPSVTNRGVGLGVGFTGPNNKLFSQFGIWKDSSESFRFYYNDFDDNDNQGYCSNFTQNTSELLGREYVYDTRFSDTFWHLLTIERVGQEYYVYIDKSDNSIPIFTKEINNSCIPNTIWFGNYVVDGGGAWSTFSLDYIRIFSDTLPTPEVTDTPIPTLTPTLTPTMIPTSTPTPTLTPSPTPTPIPKNKIIILPGLGTSWNEQAIVYGQSVDDDQWRMTPFVKNYDGLVELLEENGLVEGGDFFVWNYDWRRPISEIVDRFDVFINENIESGEKVDLIGHSLGGVVARVWTQEHLGENKVGKVIDFGAPNEGSLKAYEVWSGGKISKVSDVGSLAMQVALTLISGGPVTDLGKVRSYAPILKDLLPTNNYAIKNGRTISISNMESINDYLITKNNNFNNNLPLKSVVGVGISTPAWVKLSNRSVYEKVLGLWSDGKPVSYIYDSGDGTVLESSASFGTNELINLDSNHKDLVQNGISYLTEELGLEDKELSDFSQINFDDSLVFYLGSPARLKVTCGDDVYEDDSGFVIINDQNYDDCQVNLEPTDNGLIHLVFGNTLDGNWNYLEKQVKTNKNESFEVDFKSGDIEPNKDSKDFLISMLKEDLEKIGVRNPNWYLSRHKWSYLASKVFVYRRKNKEVVISKRILDNLYTLATINNNCSRKLIDTKWLKRYQFGVDMTVNFRLRWRRKMTEFGALAYGNLNELREKVESDLRNGICPNYDLVRAMSLGYGAEITMN